MRKSLSVFVLSLPLVLVPPIATAAVEYNVTIDSVGDPITPHRFLRVTVDGPRRRVEIQTPEKNPVAFDVFVADLDRRPEFTGLNTDLKTWWYPASPSASTLIGRAGATRNAVVKDLVVTSTEEAAGEEIQGFEARKFVIRAAFTVAASISPEQPSMRYQMTMMIWTTDRLDEATSIRAVSTSSGVPAVDSMIAAKLGTVMGFPLRTIVASSRAYTGGIPQRETVTASVSEYRTARSEPRLFEIPNGYAEQKTVIGVPGALSH